MHDALHQTGLAGALGRWIARVAGGGHTRALGVLMSAVALLSAFTHHGTMTAVMLPVTLYGSGGYRFADFIRVGAPLTVLVAVIVAVLAPLLWRG